MNIKHTLDSIKRYFVILVVVLFVFSGCVTIMHGSYHQIEVSSSPSGAKVMVDDNEVGSTPLSVKVKRSKDHIISIGIAGYEEAELKVTNHMNGWVLGNLALIVIFAPVGVAIDFISGGVYSFSVGQVYVNLEKESLSDVGRTTKDNRTEATMGENKP